MPIYETEADKTKEEIIAGIFCKRFKYNCIPAPAMARWDFCVTEPTLFKRRKPLMSNLNEAKSLDEVYNFIRMLDADGYPHAFLETDKFKFEFRKVSKQNNKSLEAYVRIIKK